MDITAASRQRHLGRQVHLEARVIGQHPGSGTPGLEPCLLPLSAAVGPSASYLYLCASVSSSVNTHTHTHTHTRGEEDFAHRVIVKMK